MDEYNGYEVEETIGSGKSDKSKSKNKTENKSESKVTKTKKAQKSQKNEKLTEYQKEKQKEIEAIELIKSYKEPAEANVIGCIYHNPEILLSEKIKWEDFTYNHWKVYFTIASELLNEQKSFSEDNIEFYLNQHPNLAEQYRLNRGYQTIEKLKEIVNPNDYEGYLTELKKWNAVLKLASKGFPVKDILSELADSTAEELYNRYTGYLNDAFIDIEEKLKTYNAFEGYHAFNEECDKGLAHGLNFSAYDPKVAKYLNQEVKGFNINGHIYGLGATSGMGKSTMAINYLFPTVLVEKKNAVFIINEEDQHKFMREAETWVINNLILANNKEGKTFKKSRFFEGNFTDEEKGWLKQAADFMESMKEQKLIYIIPLEKYTVSTVVKIIRKYAKLFGVKIFCLDTFKESADAYTGRADTWKTMERDMRTLYDTIKETALNVGLFVTYQLSKGSVKTRYLTSADIGQAKNIEDVMSVNLMIRRPFPDEFSGGKNQIKYFKPDKQRKTEIPMVLDPNKRYMILFICKNRFGSADPYQIVMECNFNTNVIKEVGTCHVMQDF